MRRASTRRGGLTLLELLASLTLVAVLAGIALLPYLGSRPERRLEEARRQVILLCESARRQAAVEARAVRVAVPFDPRDGARYGRALVVMAADGSGGWEAVGRGLRLPRGLYVDSERSSSDEGGSPVAQADMVYPWVSLPDGIAPGSAQPFVYWEMAEGGTGPAGARLTLATGTRDAAGRLVYGEGITLVLAARGPALPLERATGVE